MRRSPCVHAPGDGVEMARVGARGAAGRLNPPATATKAACAACPIIVEYFITHRAMGLRWRVLAHAGPPGG
ncbi:MAG TPA: hypothetical protein VGJ87_21605 [Roseiflexaceae bacterium]